MLPIFGDLGTVTKALSKKIIRRITVKPAPIA
jgi:hypothetical protein